MLKLTPEAHTPTTVNTLSIGRSPANAITLGPGTAQPTQMILGTAQPTQMTLGAAQPTQMVLGTAQPTQMALGTAQPTQMTIGTAQPRPFSLDASGPTADAYKRYDHRTWVYEKPDSTIGADERVLREEWLLDVQNRRMVNTGIEFTPGCERLFLEVITNASDNVGRSRRAGVDPGKIEVLMNNSTISVKNYGLPIPVEMHPTEGVYVPEMIFGSLLTSSNYEVDRHEAGTNGIGAKATNIFSTEFMVIVHDHIRGLKYTQVWNNNMTNRGDPVIEQYTGQGSSVQIVYKMDFARFKYPVPNGLEGGYPQEAYPLFARHAADISFTAKTPVVFNGHEFNFENIREYARLYFGDAVDSAVVHYQWPAGTAVTKKKKGYQIAKDPAIKPEVELIAIDTPDEGHHVSFVNCMMTRDGGVHVNAAVKAVGDSAVQMINENVLKKLTKQNKGKELDAKAKRAHTISINDVKPHISILLNVKVTNPKFTSQTKSTLHSPTPKIHVSEDELKPMNRWQLIDRLYAALEAKQFASLSKNDGKLRRYVKLLKGVDANDAGKAQRHQCILYITEGRSGAGYANKLVGLVPGGRDKVGVLPMRGKSLNVMNADRFQIERNEEINQLMKMLGLKYCPDLGLKDTFYLNPSNFDKLRYGAVMIMADSDVDGKHIIGLILNFFYCFFPSLLARGFVMYYRTPTLRATFNRQTVKFYTQREYEEWKLATPNYKDWKHKYYKGLGTSKDSEIKDDYATPRYVSCFYDEDAPAAMRLAFDKKMTDQRKDWLGKWRPVLGLGIDDIQMQPISWFINHELILFSIADTERSIPKLTDGLKESHRKILYGAHLRWKISSKNKQYSEYKVAQFGAFVADKANYHHGEVILDEVVVGMAQDFIGANNIPWFTKDGQFGCVDPNTPVLLWNGSTKLAKDISTDDVLIGDDGKERHISKIVSGTDDMYDVIQSNGSTYRVNSLHILTLYFPKHKQISWKESSNRWSIEYYDTIDSKVKSKTFSAAKSSKDEAEQQMLQFASTIPDCKIFDINLKTYLSFSPSRRELFRGVRNTVPVEWEKKDVPIDPYIFGMWLGDGQQNGRGFASADEELVKEWVKYTDTIGVEVVHNRNSNGHEGYQYGFRRRGASTGINNLIAVGHANHTSKTCGGCLSSRKFHPACDWVYEGKDNSPNRKYDNVTVEGVPRDDMNPYVKILKDNNLYKNKHIPESYITNDVETRLELLAGLIDTDGCLKFQDRESAQVFEISQEITTHGHIVDVAEYIAKSLGFKTRVSTYDNGVSVMKTLSINGDISRIPTRIPRKQATKTTSRYSMDCKIKVEYAGRGDYVGWYIDGNERFLLGDFTVTHNTRYEGGKDAAQTRYSYVRPERLVGCIIRKEDVPILTHVFDEGDKVEPETYYPIIPMILVNGGQGIGTGYSTFIPCHNPLDLIDWLRMKLRGCPDNELPSLLPWYRGFKGVISVIDRRSRKRKTNRGSIQIVNQVDENGTITPLVTAVSDDGRPPSDDGDRPNSDELLPGEEEGPYEGSDLKDGSRPLLSMVSMGDFHIELNGTIVITELPIGRWPKPYRKWLEDLVEKKKITGFRDCSVDDKAYFEIYGFTDTPNHRTLKLKRTMGMSNMVLLDENRRPVRYDTSFDIIEAFYSRRLPKYEERRQYNIDHLTSEIETLNYKIQFIQAVIDKRIRIINRRKATIYSAMDELGIPREIYDKSMAHHLSEDDIASLTQHISSKEAERDTMLQTSAEEMWIRELDELEQVYRSVYKLPKPGLSISLASQPEVSLNVVPPNQPEVSLNVIPPNQPRQPATAITLVTSPSS